MSSVGAIKVCFLGTPEFAAVHLRTLLKNPNYQVVGVLTQPDRPAGRKLQQTPSAVKVLALENNLPLLTPDSKLEDLKKSPDMLEQIKSWQADVAVVVAFGQILSQDFLDSFKFGAVNVHGSLLPLWRGAAPIQRSIEAGDAETGVTLQRMVKKLDAGPVIGKRVIKLDAEITAAELYQKLAVLGCELLEYELRKYIKGELIPEEQDEARVTLAKKIEKEESLLSWNLSAITIHNRVRALTMGPGTYVMFQGKRLKIHKTKIQDKTVQEKTVQDKTVQDKASPEVTGAIVYLSPTALHIQTSQGVLALLEVQPESKSKSKTAIADFLKSVALKKGDLFV